MRRSKEVAENVLRSAACSVPLKVTACSRYAKYLRARQRIPEAERFELVAAGVAGSMLPGFDYSPLLRALGSDEEVEVEELAAGIVVRISALGWDLWCEGARLRSWIYSSPPEELTFDKVPGEFPSPSQTQLGQLWEAAVALRGELTGQVVVPASAGWTLFRESVCLPGPEGGWEERWEYNIFRNTGK